MYCRTRLQPSSTTNLPWNKKTMSKKICPPRAHAPPTPVLCRPHSGFLESRIPCPNGPKPAWGPAQTFSQIHLPKADHAADANSPTLKWVQEAGIWGEVWTSLGVWAGVHMVCMRSLTLWAGVGYSNRRGVGCKPEAGSQLFPPHQAQEWNSQESRKSKLEPSLPDCHKDRIISAGYYDRYYLTVYYFAL